MKFIAYIRKSTDDKKHQVKSIPNQLEWVTETAQKLNAEIIETFVDKKTARKPGRVGFNAMMELVENSTEPLGVICWKVSRLARNPIDEGAIKYAFMLGKIKHIYASDRQFREGENQILMGVEFGAATQYSIDLASSTNFGMKKKAASGFRPTLAPLGYINDPNGLQGEKKIYKDPERFDQLKMAWKKLMSGAYSVEAIRQELNANGFTTRKGRPLPKSTLYNIFSNIFYSGQYRWNKEIYTGKYPRMVTPAEFEKVQEILHKWKWGKNYKTNTLSTYNGLLLCGECGYKITTYCKTKTLKKTGNIKTYTYLKCTKKNPEIKCTQSQINEQKAEQQITKLLGEIEIKHSFVKWMIGFVKRREKETAKIFVQKKRVVQKQYNELKTMMDALIDNLNSRAISLDQYNRTMDRYSEKEKTLKRKMQSFNTVDNDWYSRIEQDLFIASTAKKHFIEGGRNQKREILSRIGSNWILNDGKLLAELLPPFQLLRNHQTLIKNSFSRIEPNNLLSSSNTNYSFEDESLIWGQFLDEMLNYYRDF